MFLSLKLYKRKKRKLKIEKLKIKKTFKMKDTFYLFETQIPFYYKFGMTGRNLWERIKEYSGLNKKKRIVGFFVCDDGLLIEKKFKLFLKKYNIKVIRGKEYFYFEGSIDILYTHFLMIKHKIKKKKKIQTFDFNQILNKMEMKLKPILKRKHRQFIKWKRQQINFTLWFFNNYKVVNENNINSVVSCKNVYKKFKKDEQYLNLTKKEKRKLNKKELINNLLKNYEIRKLHKTRFQPRDVNGKQCNFTNIFIHIEEKN